MLLDEQLDEPRIDLEALPRQGLALPCRRQQRQEQGGPGELGEFRGGRELVEEWFDAGVPRRPAGRRLVRLCGWQEDTGRAGPPLLVSQRGDLRLCPRAPPVEPVDGVRARGEDRRGVGAAEERLQYPEGALGCTDI